MMKPAMIKLALIKNPPPSRAPFARIYRVTLPVVLAAILATLAAAAYAQTDAQDNAPAEHILLDAQRIAQLPVGRPQPIEQIARGQWGYVEFDPDKIATPAQYEIVPDDFNSDESGDDESSYALKVTAINGASLFFLRFESPIDLRETPVLTFDWRVDRAPTAGPPEDTKDGDDFAFRIYLTRGGKVRSQTLNLVRARDKPIGATWPSPYKLYDNFFHKVRMRAFANATSPNGVWRTQQLNIAQTWREVFATAPVIDGVGFMADSDNAGGAVVARFRRIRLSAGAE